RHRFDLDRRQPGVLIEPESSLLRERPGPGGRRLARKLAFRASPGRLEPAARPKAPDLRRTVKGGCRQLSRPAPTPGATFLRRTREELRPRLCLPVRRAEPTLLRRVNTARPRGRRRGKEVNERPHPRRDLLAQGTGGA